MTRSRKRAVQWILAGSASAAVLATAAWALTGSLRQPARLLDSGGEMLTGTNVISTVTLGESLVGPLEMTGPGVVMHPGFIAKKKAMQAQTPVSVDDSAPLPSATHLGDSYPNPFSAATTVRFGLAEAGPVAIHVYDAAGRLVREVVNDGMAAGFHQLTWNGDTQTGERAPSGVYFVRMSTPRFADNRKVILSR